MKRIFIILLILSFNLIHAEESVICIPGFLVPYRHMSKIESLFKCSNMNTYIWNYSSRERTIEQHAVKLCRILQCYAENNPSEPINFVCHSVGALILKAALNYPYCPEEAKIGKVVLLAPCARGSILARQMKNVSLVAWIMGSKTGWQLMNYTPEVMDERYEEFPESLSILLIAGDKGSRLFFRVPNDEYLTVDETEISTPHLRYVLHLNHSELLRDPCSLSLTKNFILGK